MVHIRFYLHTPKKTKSPLYCRVHANSTALPACSIGESLVPDRFDEVKKKIVLGEWDHEAQRVRAKHMWAAEVNAKIQRIKLEVGQQFRAMLEKGQEPTSEDLRRIINPAKVEKKQAGPVLVSEYYDAWSAWYKAKKNRGKKDVKVKPENDYVRGFKQIVDKVHVFRPKAKLKDFLPDFRKPHQEGLLDEFEDWVMNKYKLQENTVVRYRKLFRVLFKFAGMPSDWLEVGSARGNEKFALEWSEVVKLSEHTYSKDHITRAAHVAVIISQLALRWGDFSTLKKGHIIKVQSFRHGEVLVANKNQGKTGRPVYVPFPPLARKIFDLYGEIPLKVTTRNQLSDSLKDAAREAGLTRKVRTTKTYNGHVTEEWREIHLVISPHIMRHTGATLIDAISKGRDKFMVKTLLGHTVNDATSGYVHANPIVAVDDLLDAWAEVAKPRPSDELPKQSAD